MAGPTAETSKTKLQNYCCQAISQFLSHVFAITHHYKFNFTKCAFKDIIINFNFIAPIGLNVSTLQHSLCPWAPIFLKESVSTK